MKTLILLFIVLVIVSSCSQNRKKINANEQELAAQIASEEKEKLEAESAKQAIQPIADTFPPGFRFQEDRSVDPENPPTLIDVLGTLKNIREFKLSDVASSINYIKLETPPDSTLLWTHPKLNSTMPSVISDDKHIFVQGLYGVTRFLTDGKFQELIWKNKSGINVSQRFVSISPTELNGVTPDNPISIFNGNLFIRFQDGKNGQVQIIRKKVQNDRILNNPLIQQEIKQDTFIGERLLTIREKYMSRKYPLIFGLSQNSWAGIQDTWNSAKTGNLFVVFNNNGDTLCAISNPNKIKNWSKSLVRAGEPFTYYYKNHLTFLGQYSDTIFRIIPPNRLLPVFLFDFGKDKVGFFEGVDPDTDLSQKLMLHSIFETDAFLFIRYTRNSAGPKNLENKSVTFYNAIFNKNENKLYHFPEQSLNPMNIVNDVDGGISFWPEFVTPKGDLLMLITGSKIKEYVNSVDFKNKIMTEEQRQKQIGMSNSLNDFDKLVVVVE